MYITKVPEKIQISHLMTNIRNFNLFDQNTVGSSKYIAILINT